MHPIWLYAVVSALILVAILGVVAATGYHGINRIRSIVGWLVWAAATATVLALSLNYAS
jgi:hypothetical protein